MDPWPKQEDEPKAPDKLNNNEKDSSDAKFVAVGIIPTEEITNECDKNRLISEQDSTFTSLDDSSLKALLEEAMSYKTPKDAQGKSALFKELLQSVGSENQFPGRERQEKTARRSRRRQPAKKDTDKSTTHGSLQDLAADVHQESVEETIKTLTMRTNDILLSTQECNPLRTNCHIETNIDADLKPVKCSLLNERDDFLSAIERPLSAAIDGTSKDTLVDKKNVDENGNAVSTLSADKVKKSRRIKAKNDKNIILSHHIEGHRSDISQDIDALVKYIESPAHRDQVKTKSAGGHVVNKLHPVRDKSSDTARKGRKPKETNFHKSNSLEEMAVSKFEDLTERNCFKSERGSNERVSSLAVKQSNSKELASSNHGSSSPSYYKDDMELMPESDFHTVTKKQKKKKVQQVNKNRIGQQVFGGRHERNFNTKDTKQRDFLPFKIKKYSQSKRRKSTSSVPSSEKSGDCSDTDSIHSLPISSTRKENHSEINSDSTKHISYADITRALPSPDRVLQDSDNVSIGEEKKGLEVVEKKPEQEVIPTVVLALPQKKAKEEINKDFPPLLQVDKTEKINNKSNDMFVEFTLTVPNKKEIPCKENNVEETVYVKTPCNFDKAKTVATKLTVANDQAKTVATASITITVANDKAKTVPNSSKEDENLNKKLVVYQPKTEDEPVVTKRPPVILMSEESTATPPSVEDLEFGFEVNEQLLHNPNAEDTTKSCVKNIPNPTVLEWIEQIDQKDYESKVTFASMQATDSQVIDYVSTEWKRVLIEASKYDGSTKYFSIDDKKQTQ